MDKNAVHFLLVEDDDDHAEFVMRGLRTRRENNFVVRLCDGAEAIAYLEGEGEYSGRVTPNVVLLDLKLPKVDGLDVLTYIKSEPALRTIPVVVLTTSDADSDRARAYENQANSYLVKPVDYARFRQMIHDLDVYWGDWNRDVAELR